MKAKYQIPSIEFMASETENMIAASPAENGFDMENPIGETTATSGNLSRQDIWEFEDEE